MYRLSCGPRVWAAIAEKGGRFVVDREKCAGCRICEMLCPVDNISVDVYPAFGDSYQQCMRCISLCPQGVIYMPGKKYVTNRTVKAKDLILREEKQ